MNPIFRNLAACVSGLVIGSVVNMTIVMLGSSWIAPPHGVDMSDTGSIARSIHLFGPQHFAPPFFAHAFGTLSGAAMGARFAASRVPMIAYGIGAFFFAGGVAMTFAIPAPAWFVVADLVLAYFPMSYLALKLAPGATSAPA